MYLCEFHYRKRRIRSGKKKSREAAQFKDIPGPAWVDEVRIMRPPDQTNVCEDAEGGFLANDGLYAVRRVKRHKG